MILILAGNAFLFYSSHLGVEAFYRQAIPCFCLDVLSSEKKEVYIYVKGHLTYNQSVCQITRLLYPHALRTYVPSHLTCLRLSSYYVPTCLRLLNYYVSTCLRALSYYMSTCVPTCPHFSRAYRLMCRNIFFVPTCLRALNYFVPTCRHCARAYVPTTTQKIYRDSLLYLVLLFFSG